MCQCVRIWRALSRAAPVPTDVLCFFVLRGRHQRSLLLLAHRLPHLGEALTRVAHREPRLGGAERGAAAGAEQHVLWGCSGMGRVSTSTMVAELRFLYFYPRGLRGWSRPGYFRDSPRTWAWEARPGPSRASASWEAGARSRRSSWRPPTPLWRMVESVDGY